MQGLHLTADLHGCPASALMTDPHALRDLCLTAVRAAGLRPVGELFHRFSALVAATAPQPPCTAGGSVNTSINPGTGPGATPPTGITGVVLLAESHVAVHTWPEMAAATLDVYVCNLGTDNSACAHTLLGRLVEAFAPAQVERHELRRGQRGAPA